MKTTINLFINVINVIILSAVHNFIYVSLCTYMYNMPSLPPPFRIYSKYYSTGA